MTSCVQPSAAQRIGHRVRVTSLGGPAATGMSSSSRTLTTRACTTCPPSTATRCTIWLVRWRSRSAPPTAAMARRCVSTTSRPETRPCGTTTYTCSPIARQIRGTDAGRTLAVCGEVARVYRVSGRRLDPSCAGRPYDPCVARVEVDLLTGQANFAVSDCRRGVFQVCCCSREPSRAAGRVCRGPRRGWRAVAVQPRRSRLAAAPTRGASVGPTSRDMRRIGRELQRCRRSVVRPTPPIQRDVGSDQMSVESRPLRRSTRTSVREVVVPVG
jgi:hypothetical protein